MRAKTTAFVFGELRRCGARATVQSVQPTKITVAVNTIGIEAIFAPMFLKSELGRFAPAMAPPTLCDLFGERAAPEGTAPIFAIRLN